MSELAIVSCEVSLTGSPPSVTSVVSIYLLSSIPNKVIRGAFVSFYWAKSSRKMRISMDRDPLFAPS